MSNARSPLQYKGVRAIRPPDLTIADRGPSASDKAYIPGQLWLDKTGLATYQFSGVSWITLGAGAAGGVVSLTGDSGGAIAPVGGNIDVVGDATDGVSVVGTVGTLTINVAAASTTQRGTMETATNAEAIAGSSSIVAVTPAALQAKIGTQTAHGVAMGSTGATAALSWSAAGTAGQVFTSGGAAADGAYVGFTTPGSTLTITSNATTQAFDVNVATQAQVNAGTSATTFVTPATLAGNQNSFGAMTFNENPVLQSVLTTGAAPSGATGATNIMMLQGGEVWEEFILGAGQTIIAPRMSSTGLLISLDLTNAEGAEYNPGPRNNTKYSYTIGTTAAFSFECTLNAADVSGCDPLLIGFRKVEANNATFADYTDYASIGLSASDGANIWLKTELNAGGQTSTDTTNTWTDGQSKTLKVLVSAAGVVTYTIGGVAPSVTAAFTFDAGDVVIPFIRLTHAAAAPGAINWLSFKCGLQ